MDRLQELNKFLQFVISKPIMHDLVCVKRFFDITITNTKYAELADSFEKPNYLEIFKKMAELFPYNINVG